MKTSLTSHSPELLNRLIARISAELSSTLGAPGLIHLNASHATIDIMGGLASAQGSPHVTLPLAPAVAVALRSRTDRRVRILSFNELDQQRPFTLDLQLDATNPLFSLHADAIKRGLNSPGAAFASPVIGPLAQLHHLHHIDLHDARITGFDLAFLSDIPPNPELNPHLTTTRTSLNILLHHLNLDRHHLSPQPNQPAAPIPADQRHALIDAVARNFLPQQLLRHAPSSASPVHFDPPPGVHVVAIDIGFDIGIGRAIDQTADRTGPTIDERLDLLHQSASIAHALLLAQMHRMGREAGHELISDPMEGQLARLDPEDYKRFFRNALPESITGRDLLQRFPAALTHLHPIDPAHTYPIQPAADHFIFEARRTREFIRHLSDARNATDPKSRGLSLDKAGHLMYASHKSAADSATISSPNADRLVEVLRSREPAGIYGARLAGTGRGIIVTLANNSPQAHQAIDESLAKLAQETGLSPSRIHTCPNPDSPIITHRFQPTHHHDQTAI